MNRCTVIDLLEDEYGIKPENLTEREKAIIGLCTNQFIDNEEEALHIHDVVGRSEQLPPRKITNKEYKYLMKSLYQKDNSKRFRR